MFLCLKNKEKKKHKVIQNSWDVCNNLNNEGSVVNIKCNELSSLVGSLCICVRLNELHHDKTNKAACAPSQDSDQPGHPPSLIRVFAVRLKKAMILSY